MAKTRTKRAPKESGADSLPAVLQRQIDGIRKPFMAYAEDFAPAFERRAELAPRFMAIYRAWREHMGAGTAGSFIGYVRKIDPQVPALRDGKDGYKAHATYAAADYLRRLTAGRRDNEAKEGPTVSQQLARAIATIRPLLKNDEVIWHAVERELGLTGRKLTNLQALVAKAQPLFKLPNARPMDVTDRAIIHVVPSKMATGRGATTGRQTIAA